MDSIVPVYVAWVISIVFAIKMFGDINEDD